MDRTFFLSARVELPDANRKAPPSAAGAAPKLKEMLEVVEAVALLLVLFTGGKEKAIPGALVKFIGGAETVHTYT